MQADGIPELPQADRRGSAFDQFEVVAILHFAGSQHAVIPTANATFGDVARHPFDAVARFDFPARRARLAQLHARGAERENIADADRAFVRTARGNIFAQRAGLQLAGDVRECFGETLQIFLWIVMQRFLRPAVNTPIGLAIALQTFAANGDAAAHRLFENRGRAAIARHGLHAAGEQAKNLQFHAAIMEARRWAAATTTSTTGSMRAGPCNAAVVVKPSLLICMLDH
jgi:hypothetical protein